MDLSVALDFVVGLAQQNPKLAGICIVAYPVGIAVKIAREAVEKFVLESPSKEDDKKLEEVKKSPVFKAVEFVLDLLLRIKKPEAK